jgi:hypothetical protein
MGWPKHASLLLDDGHGPQGAISTFRFGEGVHLSRHLIAGPFSNALLGCIT